MGGAARAFDSGRPPTAGRTCVCARARRGRALRLESPSFMGRARPHRKILARPQHCAHLVCDTPAPATQEQMGAPAAPRAGWSRFLPAHLCWLGGGRAPVHVSAQGWFAFHRQIASPAPPGLCVCVCEMARAQYVCALAKGRARAQPAPAPSPHQQPRCAPAKSIRASCSITKASPGKASNRSIERCSSI